VSDIDGATVLRFLFYQIPKIILGTNSQVKSSRQTQALKSRILYIVNS